MRTSYETSYLIAKSIKPFSVGENLVLPAAVKMSEIVRGKNMRTIFAKYPYPMTLLPEELLKLVTTNLSSLSFAPKYAIQLDETTDVPKLHSCYFTCGMYIHEENVEEELLFCRSLKSHTKGEDIFFQVDEFFTTAGLQWENCVGVCTDGAEAMVCKRAWFVAKVKEPANPERVTFTHCMIHREALAAKQISLDLDISRRCENN